MTVGALAHLFGTHSYKEMARTLGDYEVNHVQLAIWKAFNDYDFTNPGILNPGLVRNIKKEFDRNGVDISIIACYLHLFDEDELNHQVFLQRYKELIRYASQFGAPMIATEVGRPRPNGVFEKDWDKLYHSLLELIEEAKAWGVIVGLEAAHGHLIGSASTLKQMLDELNSSQVGVVLDPGNLLTQENYLEQDEVIEEAFQLLGDRIVACHAKDRFIDDSGVLKETSPGLGLLNYDLFLKRLHQYKPECPIIIEHTKPSDMKRVIQYIEQKRSKYV
ncbi:sugar phosphate isomerase/epimerase [Bacillus sp. JCM 19034]|uniref:sugar phosphate isomerase/epimerase family protein n=1 Tax=Bacillus sp. JCM 19034 TaxID=1481928 RepID=UPI0007866E6B|nr:sugar phosphate isomerase/epimerase [Bacillus sp. JCM 19034]